MPVPARDVEIVNRLLERLVAYIEAGQNPGPFAQRFLDDIAKVADLELKYALYGMLCYAQGDYEKGTAWFESAVKLVPDSPFVWRNYRASVLVTQGLKTSFSLTCRAADALHSPALIMLLLREARGVGKFALVINYVQKWLEMTREQDRSEEDILTVEQYLWEEKTIREHGKLREVEYFLDLMQDIVPKKHGKSSRLFIMLPAFEGGSFLVEHCLICSDEELRVLNDILLERQEIIDPLVAGVFTNRTEVGGEVSYG